MLARPKFAFEPDAIASALAMFRARGELAAPKGPAPALPDPGDAKFLHCTEAAGAEYLVTGNKRHFPARSGRITRVVNAGELLDRIRLEI